MKEAPLLLDVLCCGSCVSGIKHSCGVCVGEIKHNVANSVDVFKMLMGKMHIGKELR